MFLLNVRIIWSFSVTVFEDSNPQMMFGRARKGRVTKREICRFTSFRVEILSCEHLQIVLFIYFKFSEEREIEQNYGQWQFLLPNYCKFKNEGMYQIFILPITPFSFVSFIHKTRSQERI
jgi:hypothetical protein